MEKKSKSTTNKKPPFCIEDLLKAKNLEIVTAALLISGELKVDSFTIDRKGGVALTLLGEFKTKDSQNQRVADITSFLKRNGHATLDDIFAAFKNHMKE